jgi:hypothetical protein
MDLTRRQAEDVEGARLPTRAPQRAGADDAGAAHRYDADSHSRPPGVNDSRKRHIAQTCKRFGLFRGQGIIVPWGAGRPPMGWPRTLNRRPRIARPTGTPIGRPVSSTGNRRHSPAVFAHSSPSHRARVNVLLQLNDRFRPVVTLNGQRVVDAGFPLTVFPLTVPNATPAPGPYQ